MPESGHLIQGDFNRDGVDDAAILLESTSSHYLLVAERAKNQNWKRAALLKVQGDKIVWNGKALVVKERGQNSQFVAFVNGRYRTWQGPLAVYCFEYDDNAFSGTMLKMTYLGPQSEPYPDLLIGSFYHLPNPARFGDRIDENNILSKDMWCLTVKPETISKFIHALIELDFDQRAQDRSSKSGTMKHLLSIVDTTSAKRPNNYKLLLYGNESSSLLAAFSKALKQDNSQGAALLDDYARMFKN